MAWITLTRADMDSRLSKPELDRLPAVARALGITSAQVLDRAVSEVVREVRGHVAVNNTLGVAGTIPDELEGAALALIRRALFGRIPGLEDLFGEIRRAEAADAQSLLRRVAEGKFQIVPPEEPAPSNEQAGNYSSKVVAARPDVLGGDALNGL